MRGNNCLVQIFVGFPVSFPVNCPFFVKILTLQKGTRDKHVLELLELPEKCTINTPSAGLFDLLSTLIIPVLWRGDFFWLSALLSSSKKTWNGNMKPVLAKVSLRSSWCPQAGDTSCPGLSDGRHLRWFGCLAEKSPTWRIRMESPRMSGLFSDPVLDKRWKTE